MSQHDCFFISGFSFLTVHLRTTTRLTRSERNPRGFSTGPPLSQQAPFIASIHCHPQPCQSCRGSSRPWGSLVRHMPRSRHLGQGMQPRWSAPYAIRSTTSAASALGCWSACTCSAPSAFSRYSCPTPPPWIQTAPPSFPVRSAAIRPPCVRAMPSPCRQTRASWHACPPWPSACPHQWLHD